MYPYKFLLRLLNLESFQLKIYNWQNPLHYLVKESALSRPFLLAMLLLAFQVIRIRLHSYVEDMYNESGINRYLSSLRDSLTRKLKIKKLIGAYDSDGIKDAVIDKYLSWLKYLYRPGLFLFLLSLILLIISIFINGYYRIINGN